MKFGILTLGCDKNTVDSEYYAAEFAKLSIECLPVGIEPEYDDSMLNGVLINTCGFIESSKSQSIEAILNWARLRASLQRKKRSFRLFVVGCLSQRYAKELPSELPEVDGWLGIADFPKLARLLAAGNGCGLIDTPGDPSIPTGQERKRLDHGKNFYAFLKIGDGCSHRCSFCAIPLIKGAKQISVPREQVLAEAQELLADGVRELCLVAQDTAAYGRDLYGMAYGLTELLADLAALPVPGQWWIRLLYVYPAGVTPRLLKVMAAHSDRIIPYLDMPLQHLHPDVLVAMRRPNAKLDIATKVKSIRKALPDVTLRTTFILGFPGETAAQFKYLCDGVKTLAFDHVGTFVYSAEEGTDAVTLKPKVSARTAAARQKKLMTLQEGLARASSERWVGRIVPVLVEDEIETGRWVGRSWRDAPDVDGVVVFDTFAPVHAGEFVDVVIRKADVHDLYGEAIPKGKADLYGTSK